MSAPALRRLLIYGPQAGQQAHEVILAEAGTADPVLTLRAACAEVRADADAGRIAVTPGFWSRLIRYERMAHGRGDFSTFRAGLGTPRAPAALRKAPAQTVPERPDVIGMSAGRSPAGERDDNHS